MIFIPATFLIPCSIFVFYFLPNSEFPIPNSDLPIPHSELPIPNSAFRPPHSELRIPTSAFRPPASAFGPVDSLRSLPHILPDADGGCRDSCVLKPSTGSARWRVGKGIDRIYIAENLPTRRTSMVQILMAMGTVEPIMKVGTRMRPKMMANSASWMYLKE